MRLSVVMLATVCAFTFAHAAFAESAPAIGSVPDPGLQSDAGRKDRVPPKKQARAVTKFDTLDDEIVDLPQQGKQYPNFDLRLIAGSTDETIERLVYDISVNRLPAGKAEFELKRLEKYGKATNPVPVFAASMTTRSNRAMSLMYEVRDRVSSIFDAKGGFSRVFSMDRREGESRVAERITFNYDKDSISALYERPRQDEDKDAKWISSTIQMTGKAVDPLAALYFMRSNAINLKNIVPGKTKAAITLPVCSDRHVWNTRMYAVGLDHIDIGTFKNRECLIVEVDAPFRGLFEHVGKTRVWFDVEKGVVVKMTAEIPIGPAEAILNLDESKNSPLHVK
ncbi:MAG: DUF3108 domain-containing protein [Planctomycetota bacterium]